MQRKLLTVGKKGIFSSGYNLLLPAPVPKPEHLLDCRGGLICTLSPLNPPTLGGPIVLPKPDYLFLSATDPEAATAVLFIPSPHNPVPTHWPSLWCHDF